MFNRAVLAGLASGALWGFAFVVPKIVTEVPSSMIACGRFLFFGFVSLLMLAVQWKEVRPLLQKSALAHACLFAIMGNSLYYFMLVLGIRYAGITASSLIIGLLPVTVAIAGNRGRLSFRLVPSLSLIVAGIGLINVQLFSKGIVTGEEPFLGVVFLLVSLALWTWYAVRNASFLKKNPRISGTVWSSLTGAFTLLFSPLIVAVTLNASESVFSALATSSAVLTSWLIWSAVLGVGASWVALWFWNYASHRLPTALAGQLIVSETVFALIYGFILESRGPTMVEAAAICVMIMGVILAVRELSPKERV